MDRRRKQRDRLCPVHEISGSCIFRFVDERVHLSAERAAGARRRLCRNRRGAGYVESSAARPAGRSAHPRYVLPPEMDVPSLVTRFGRSRWAPTGGGAELRVRRRAEPLPDPGRPGGTDRRAAARPRSTRRRPHRRGDRHRGRGRGRGGAPLPGRARRVRGAGHRPARRRPGRFPRSLRLSRHVRRGPGPALFTDVEGDHSPGPGRRVRGRSCGGRRAARPGRARREDHKFVLHQHGRRLHLSARGTPGPAAVAAGRRRRGGPPGTTGAVGLPGPVRSSG